jgi:hypothetical protein
MDVVRPAVQQDDNRAIRRAVLGIADIENAGVDLLERGECRAGSPQARRLNVGLRLGRLAEHKRCHRNAQGGGAEEMAAILADVI